MVEKGGSSTACLVLPRIRPDPRPRLDPIKEQVKEPQDTTFLPQTTEILVTSVPTTCRPLDWQGVLPGEYVEALLECLQSPEGFSVLGNCSKR